VTPNTSLMLTRLAGENALVLGLPRYARMGGAMPEPPGSIARAVGRRSGASSARSAHRLVGQFETSNDRERNAL
jgi:hypothetical protein